MVGGPVCSMHENPMQRIVPKGKLLSSLTTGFQK